MVKLSQGMEAIIEAVAMRHSGPSEILQRPVPLLACKLCGKDFLVQFWMCPTLNLLATKEYW